MEEHFVKNGLDPKGEWRYRHLCKKCHNERQAKAYRSGLNRPDVVYDYKFALFAGYSHDQALNWLHQGYRGMTMEKLEAMELQRHRQTEWTPDPIEDEE